MPYKNVTPAENAEMKRRRYIGHHTICEKLREIWRESDDPNIKEKAKLAMAMAKKMHFKLKEFEAYRLSGENHEEESPESTE